MYSIIMYFNSLKIPVRVQIFMGIFLTIGLLNMSYLMFNMYEYLIDTIISDILIHTSIFFPILIVIKWWFSVIGEKIKKIFFLSLWLIVLYGLNFCTMYSVFYVYLKLLPSQNSLNLCLPVIESGDYESKHKFDGTYVVLNFKGSEIEVRIPSDEFEKMNAQIPSCLNVIIEHKKFNCYYLKKVIW